MIRPRVTAILTALAFAALFPLGVLGAETTADLELQEGYVDPQSGDRVDKITPDETAQTQQILLAVPRTSGPIDEVVVMGKRPESTNLVELLQSVPHRFVNDYDHDYYGLVIYLGRKETLPIRLYLNSAQHDPGAIAP